MKSQTLIGLSSFILWLPGFIRQPRHNEQTVWIIPVIFILLSCFLFAGNKRALRIYRFLLWFGLVVNCMLVLLSMSGVDTMHDIFVELTHSQTLAEAIWYTLFWIAFLGWILYYSEKDSVRAAYGLQLKENGNKSSQES
jgi:amino acid transporter